MLEREPPKSATNIAVRCRRFERAKINQALDLGLSLCDGNV